LDTAPRPRFHGRRLGAQYQSSNLAPTLVRIMCKTLSLCSAACTQVHLVADARAVQVHEYEQMPSTTVCNGMRQGSWAPASVSFQSKYGDKYSSGLNTMYYTWKKMAASSGSSSSSGRFQVQIPSVYNSPYSVYLGGEQKNRYFSFLAHHTLTGNCPYWC
jgi:hypothetical protein